MSLIVGLIGVWLMVSVVAIGFMYIGSTDEETRTIQTVEEWDQFE